MDLLHVILCGLFILFGISLFFSPVRGAMLASIIYIGAGIAAYDGHSYLPLVIGFISAWVLQFFMKGGE